MGAHAPPGTREPETKALLFRGGCLQPARGMRLAALTHWLPAKSFFLHSSSPFFAASCIQLWLNFGGNIQTAANLCLHVYMCVYMYMCVESTPRIHCSKLYLDDTGSMLPVWLGRGMDAVFGVIIEYGIEKGEENGEIREGGGRFSNIWW